MRVYTKTGDSGTTSLIGGERVSKADPRVEAYGTVDELSSHLAMLGDMMGGVSGFVEMIAWFDEIQIDLMTVEAMQAVGEGGEGKVEALPEEAIRRLERQIDAMSENLPQPGGFTLPGGHPILSQSHICRTVCRRAERVIIRAEEEYPVQPVAREYINRLSDWLYVVGRKAVEILAVEETEIAVKTVYAPKNASDIFFV